MNLTTFDILKLLFAWIIFSILASIKVRYARKSNPGHGTVNLVAVVLRLLVVLSLFYGLFCAVLGLSVDATVIIFALVGLVISVARMSSEDDFPVADNPLGLAIAAVVWVPIYILKQFVFGFPDQDNVVLAPPLYDASFVSPTSSATASTGTPTPPTSELIGLPGTVIGMLRPAGKVEINGTHYQATTADGQMLDQGAPIEVCGWRDGQLLVRERLGEK
ncbi:MAG: NfeD family protein [Planctomycetota bacterium]|nr:NfeD family protein [Planctomycetota bacterium]MDA1215003.1 NfeD family protein [Planctomycetota bacterium]